MEKILPYIYEQIKRPALIFTGQGGLLLSYNPWAIMASEIFLNAAMSFPAMRS